MQIKHMVHFRKWRDVLLAQDFFYLLGDNKSIHSL